MALEKPFTLPTTISLPAGVARVERFVLTIQEPTKPVLEVALYASLAAMQAGAPAISRTLIQMEGFNPINVRNQVYSYLLTLDEYNGASSVAET